MKRIMTLVLLSLFATGFSFQLQAAGVDKKIYKRIKQSIESQHVFKNQKVDEIAASVIPGIYRVTINGEIYYVPESGAFLMTGNIYDIRDAAAPPKNVTEVHRSKVVSTSIKGLEGTTIDFPAGNPKHTITVFTDIDCGYCRKLHSEIANYNKIGVSIKYLAYPRAGLKSGSYDKLVSTWCADDPKAAMTMAKKGQKIPNKTCENPVERHFKLGGKLGINGTPAMILESGQIIPGYVPAEKLKGYLVKN